MEKIKMSVTLPASPEQLHKAWLSSKEHTAFTGGEAKMSAKVGSNYTAWDDYISGKTLESEPGKRILQTWRTTEFQDSDKDSMLELTFEPAAKGGCKLTLNHWDLPAGQSDTYKSGWKDYYFTPMKEYFGRK